MGKEQKTLPLVNLFAAGIDVGASCHYICAADGENVIVRRFGTFTEDLFALWELYQFIKTIFSKQSSD